MSQERDAGLKKINYLYIHIPFCVKKCIYCDFFSVSYDELSAKSYVNALCRELCLKKAYSDILKTVYIGGGTPSLLPDGCLIQLFHCLRDNFSFSTPAEISVETNPGTLNDSKINTLLSLGVNRLSIGVQSFNDGELKTLRRIHTSGDSIRSLGMLKKAGLKNFSIDLIYGIPGQTLESWKHSISKTLQFSPAHISTYELTPEKGTPLYSAIETDKIKMPNEDLILEMYDHAIDQLTRYGYEHYEISNSALPGHRCMHNLNYWERGEYIGVGAGSHSFINNTRSRNLEDIDKYIESVNKGTIPEMESTRLTPEQALKEFIFLGLRKREGINIAKKAKLSELLMNDDTGFRNALVRASEELIEEGLIEIDKDHLRLIKRGIVLSNAVIVRLFERLGL